AGDPEKSHTRDEEFMVTVTEAKGLPTGRTAGIHIRPLKMKPEELLELPLTFKLSYARAGEGQTTFRPTPASGCVDYVVHWYPANYNDRNQSTYGTVVESAKVLIPLDLEERQFHVDLKDIPIR
ncbi:MAG TPA: hypothetical protein VJU16_05975, partial [Planctomycetota bacterium]|nr:hypothetical protein [Planctomycetota bacterium]